MEGLDYSDTGGGTCTPGASCDANAACTVKVSFKPRLSRARYGAVYLFDPSGGPLGWALMQGSGLGAETSFLPAAQSKASIAVDGGGNLYIADIFNYSVFKEKLNANGNYTESLVTNLSAPPRTIEMDGAGNLYATLDGVEAVNFFIPFGQGASAGSFYGRTFDVPAGSTASAIAVDGAGTIYVADKNSNLIFVGTLSADLFYKTINFAIQNKWGAARSIAVDADGNAYALFPQHAVLKYTKANHWFETSVTGSFTSPVSMAVDMAGNVYVGDSISSKVYKESPAGGGYTETVMMDDTKGLPAALAADTMGNVYEASYISNGYSTVYKLSTANPPSLSFASTVQGAVSKDSPQVVTVSNLGNVGLKLATISYPTDFPERATHTGDCAVGTPLAPDASCTLSITFKPVTGSTGATSQLVAEKLSLVSNTLNTVGTTQLVPLTGTETGIVNPTAKPVFTPARGVYPTLVPVTISSTTAGATIYCTTDGTTPTAASAKYTIPLLVNSNITIKAIAIAKGFVNSPVGLAPYTITSPAAKPIFTRAPGAYVSVEQVSIAVANKAASIYYTTDGVTTPTAASTLYKGPIGADANTTFEAIGLLNGKPVTPLASVSYSITGSPDALSAPATGVVAPNATLNAVVATKGLAGSYVFQYGTSPTALNKSTVATALKASLARFPVSAAVAGLARKTKCYYRVVATTAGGVGSSAVMNFITN